jgi:hypothetical protein
MFMKRRFVCGTTFVVAALAAACDRAPDSAGLGGTAPSAIGGQGSAISGQGNLTAAQTAALTVACGAFGSGTVTTPGAPPPGTPPPGAIVAGPGDLGPVGSGGAVTTPGAPPGPPAAGTELAIGGTLDNLAGSCPLITFTISGKTVRTNATTSFGSGSCSLLKNSDRVGAVGTTQADGSIVASCVAGS